MRALNSALEARLSSGQLSLCLCWLIERKDGVVLGATDHDRAIEFEGIVFEPGVALFAGSFDHGANLKPGKGEGSGALSSDKITEQDLSAGLWDGAKLTVYRTDWRAPEHRWVIWSGRLSEIQTNGQRYEAQLISLKEQIERPVGRVYSRHCDAVLGDPSLRAFISTRWFHMRWPV